MGVTRVRFLLELWRRSSLNLPAGPPPEDQDKNAGRWTLPRPIPPPKTDTSRHPPRWPA